MSQNKFFLPALILPIIALLFLTFFKAYSLQSGIRFILPISGYDPVDPIAGHYVTYRVDYESENCRSSIDNRIEETCVCLSLDKESNHHYLPSCSKELLKSCDAYLIGKCRYGRFEAGIEQYFIPENKAKAIDETVRKGKSKIKISVKKDGTGIVEDLILVE